MGINNRVADLIKHLEMNPNSFADSIGVKGTVIYNIVKGRRSKPSFDLLQKILITYQTINANWLLSGQGNVLKEEEQVAEKKPVAIRLETRVNKLLIQAYAETESPVMEEIKELVGRLVQENMEQKEKITALYKKQDEILSVIRKQLNLDF